MVEGSMTCVKYLLFAFNFLFFLIGLILIIVGAVIETSFKQYFDIVEGEFSAVAVLLIAVGIIIFVIGFFGCCGALKENGCMVKTFCGLLVLIFILEISGGIAGFALRGKVESVVRKGLQESLDQYDNSTADKEMWDDIQSGLKCCGVNGYTDWAGKLGQQIYPKSCCENPKSIGCGIAPGLAYQDGCLPNLKQVFTQNLVWVGVVGIIVALVQLVGIVFACCLAKAISKEYEVV